jgi:hypothetical protein
MPSDFNWSILPSGLLHRVPLVAKRAVDRSRARDVPLALWEALGELVRA